MNDPYDEKDVKPEILALVLSKLLGKAISRAEYQTKQLQGGTLGDVRLVMGMAETSDGENLPYKVVWKTQKKWERHGDPDSWRREYDLYASDFGKSFTDSLRWPECYHAEMNGDEIQLWMEYIEGVSGLNLTNLSKVDFAKNFYHRYRSWNVVYDYIRSDDCEIPKHLCEMLIDLDNNADEIFSRIEELPIVLCHRDFWVANIICSDDKIVLIDWDTAGWGYMGEDIASLIADEADVCHMVEYCRKCIPAYYKGFSEYVDVSHISDHCVYELILVMFGYRLVEGFKFAESPGDQSTHLNTLQKIHEMRNN